ncbi:MAG: peptide chain release factor 2 [Candidatus Tectomicrobia bacterium]|nr:peptide chain release factor 2 [Candidatus Tectomicrobia bacterium]
MTDELGRELQELMGQLLELRGHLDLEGKEAELRRLDKLMQEEGFWDDPERQQEVLKKRSELQRVVEAQAQRVARLDDLIILHDLAAEEEDEAQLKEVAAELRLISDEVRALELQLLFTQENDRKNAIVAVHPGAGGTESQDWAEMLVRLYLRWAERHDFKTDILDLQPGEQAGIKSATFAVNGEYAYGYLQAEIGVHRLVRISPYDANKRRHTSFASVFVYPEVDEDITIEIDDAELRIETFRSSGAGGQHVNVTDSAVRITHLPTGIVVQCQNQRSQHKNKAWALKVLRARLYELEKSKQQERLDELHSSKREIAWGSQIRSYTLQPYQLVKDHRTGIEIGNVTAVLDGGIDEFIEAWLVQQARALQQKASKRA